MRLAVAGVFDAEDLNHSLNTLVLLFMNIKISKVTQDMCQNVFGHNHDKI